jgi:hypothetical protein
MLEIFNVKGIWIPNTTHPFQISTHCSSFRTESLKNETCYTSSLVLLSSSHFSKSPLNQWGLCGFYIWPHRSNDDFKKLEDERRTREGNKSFSIEKYAVTTQIDTMFRILRIIYMRQNSLTWKVM